MEAGLIKSIKDLDRTIKEIVKVLVKIEKDLLDLGSDDATEDDGK